MDGWSLGSLRVDKPQQRFRVEEIGPWLQQLCAALDYAHEQAGLLHLDLKPSNLLLSRNGEIKVSDFGMAGGLQKLSAPLDAQRIAERVGFMSPQQAMGETPSVTDDIYSLGATVFALLTGTPPFYKGEVLAQVRELPAPSMTARLKELGIEDAIPSPWEEAVAACLAKDPGSGREMYRKSWACSSGRRVRNQSHRSPCQKRRLPKQRAIPSQAPLAGTVLALKSWPAR